MARESASPSMRRGNDHGSAEAAFLPTTFLTPLTPSPPPPPTPPRTHPRPALRHLGPTGRCGGVGSRGRGGEGRGPGEVAAVGLIGPVQLHRDLPGLAKRDRLREARAEVLPGVVPRPPRVRPQAEAIHRTAG